MRTKYPIWRNPSGLSPVLLAVGYFPVAKTASNSGPWLSWTVLASKVARGRVFSAHAGLASSKRRKSRQIETGSRPGMDFYISAMVSATTMASLSLSNLASAIPFKAR